MPLTVRSILGKDGLSGCKVYAGHNGIDKDFKSISVLEITEKKMVKWMLPGQVYISSLYAIRDDVPMQREIIQIIAGNDCRGLILCHLDYCLKTVDGSIIKLCNELGMPLIIAEPNRSYIEILSPIFERVLRGDSNWSKSNFYYNFRRDVLDLAANAKGVHDFLSRIHELFHVAVSHFDLLVHPIYSDKPQKAVEKESIYIKKNMMEIRDHCSYGNYYTWEESGGTQLIALVNNSNRVYGFIVIDPGESVLEEEEYEEFLATLSFSCTMLGNAGQNSTDVLEQHANEFYTSLFSGNFTSNDVALKRSQEVGIDISKADYLLVIDLCNLTKEFKIKPEKVHRDVCIQSIPVILELIRFYNATNLAVFYEGLIVVLIENRGNRIDIMDIAGRIAEVCAGMGEVHVSVGISDMIAEIVTISKAYQQAHFAASFGEWMPQNPQILRYADVWSLDFFWKNPNERELLQMEERVLRPLVEYDHFNESDLVVTLKCLLLNNMDMKETANRLFIHRNTLLYRKNKIIELLGYSPFEVPYVMNMMLIVLGGNLETFDRE
ncbi:PucR family transcriptional regulator ligand-binding domain-containing protein [Ruminococcaceae bacterium OttesenSCG-928-I18]|nr:PucR family transcriptional regulator ligand-binding domain-containing protein [Ruminococcaceae bacterium OttesenSCG-928-I18]